MERVEKTSEPKLVLQWNQQYWQIFSYIDGEGREKKRELNLIELEMKEGVITTDLMDMKNNFKGIIWNTVWHYIRSLTWIGQITQKAQTAKTISRKK